MRDWWDHGACSASCSDTDDRYSQWRVLGKGYHIPSRRNGCRSSLLVVLLKASKGDHKTSLKGPKAAP